MSRIYNWGIIGPGRIAHKFAKDLTAQKDARLHAVASRSKERAKTFADQYQATYHFGNYAELMDCPDLDVIYIATPHVQHWENTLMCLNAGIPVLCEKPFAMNLQQVQQMIALAREKQTFLMEAIWTRFSPSMKKTLELIQNDSIGEVISLKADFGFKAVFDPQKRLFNRDLGGGSLLDIGIYPVFLALLILGKPIGVKAFAKMSETGVDEECGVLLQFTGGKMAHLHSTLIASTKTEAFIYGTKGTIHMHSGWHRPTNITLIKEGERPKEIQLEKQGFGYTYEIAEVVKCLSEKKLESDLLPLSFSRDLIELLDTIRAEAGIYYPKFDD